MNLNNMKNKQNEVNGYKCVKCETGETETHGDICSCKIKELTDEELKNKLQVIAIELDSRNFDVEQHLKDLFKW